MTDVKTMTGAMSDRLGEPDSGTVLRPGIRLMRLLGRAPTFLFGCLILSAFLAMALFGRLFYPVDPAEMVAAPTLWPGEDPALWLGSDSLGRDVAAGLVHGSRASLLVGFLSASIGLFIGVVVGALAGYCRGWVAAAALRLTELFQTVPTFILVIVIVTILRPSTVTIAAAIGLATWPTIARLTRAQFLSLRETEFVLAARSIGLRPFDIVFREIMPNAISPILVTLSVMVANAILIEAGLSFLKLGDPNLVSWGGMIGEGRPFLRTAWYLTAVPGAALALTVLSLNLIGDGLNDMLNPRSGGR